ncbi:MAG: hemerythrin domain-containing protein [Zoogloeaceae bacterium]|nr:hemerythrin domain-containing protein [Zoogloeaceae bacterium]
MSSSLIPVAPGFETPLEMLEACHERLDAQLQTLVRLVEWLEAHGADREAVQAATNVMRYFDTAAVNHHLDEEQDLMPTLLVRVRDDERARLQSLVDWILADHQRLFFAWRDMRETLEPLSRGESVVLKAERVNGFAELYRQHIAREEGELLPWAQALLSDEDIAMLGRTMSARRTVAQTRA